MQPSRPLIATLCVISALACNRESKQAADSSLGTPAESAAAAPRKQAIPPDAEHAVASLNASTRHGQYVMVPAGGSDSIRAWIVYPASSTKAPVVVVVHEIFGMSSWIRSVADQLAAAGYIAIVPDLLSKEKLSGAPDSVSMQDGMAAVSKLNKKEVLKQIDVTARYATALPAALPKYGIVGFCWGGGVAFNYVAQSPNAMTAVIYYGESPKPDVAAKVSVPVLGLYGQEDARVTMDVPTTDSVMKTLKKTYVYHIYDGAEHGFLRAQGGANGANLSASQQAWPTTIDWLHKYLGT
jgi:carboxymethylenebutenolidase